MEGRGRGSGRRRAERTGTDMRGGESNGLKRVPQGGVVGKVTPRQKPRHKFGGCNGEKYIFSAVIPAKSMLNEIGAFARTRRRRAAMSCLRDR